MVWVIAVLIGLVVGCFMGFVLVHAGRVMERQLIAKQKELSDLTEKLQTVGMRSCRCGRPLPVPYLWCSHQCHEEDKLSWN